MCSLRSASLRSPNHSAYAEGFSSKPLPRHITFGNDMAEGVGFEPTSPFGEAVFKTAALNHSAIPPQFRLR